MRALIVVAGLALAALGVAPSRGRAQDLGLQVGSTAPPAKVFTLDGQQADLAQYIGKTPMVIEFWATWCPNCAELEPTLLDVARKYGQRVKFVGVAVSVNETPARVKAFVAKHGLPGDQYFDSKGDATDAYDAPATSYVVVVDRTGKVAYTGLGGKQDLEGAIKKVL